MIAFYIALFIIAVLTIESAMVTVVHRQAQGMMEIISDWQRMLVFKSDTGTFSVRSDLKHFEYSMNGMQDFVVFKDIKHIELSVISKDAALGEFLLDMDMDECWSDEQDYIDWHVVSMVLVGGEKIPLFRSGEYHRRKYWHAFYTETQVALLKSFGLIVDVKDRVRETIERLRFRINHLQVIYSNHQ